MCFARSASALIVACVLAGLAVGQSTTRVSLSDAEAQVNGGSDYPVIGANSRFVAFESTANNLVPGDTNGKLDVFLRDRLMQTTTRVSVSSGGTQGDGNSQEPSISADGRYVAFTSYATNLVPGDTNSFRDIFVRDTQLGTTTRVSVASGGIQANGFSEYPAISKDGRFVTFQSSALNLDPPDLGFSDIFIHDRLTGVTKHMSVTSGNLLANGASIVPTINADGRFVAFESYATNLGLNDTNGWADVFVHDRLTGLTEMVSLSSGGAIPNATSYRPSLSADARFVAFESLATNLVPNDTNAVRDIFVRDRDTDTTTRVSVSTAGLQANAACFGPSISADGKYVIFYSIASNLVEGDSNDGVDVYLYDREAGTTSRISVSTAGGQGNGVSQHAAISSDGGEVVFHSGATNLIAGDTNNVPDIFAHWIGTAPYNLLSVNIAPASVVGGTGATGTVTLTNGAPLRGFIYLYSSNTSAATTPFYVQVPPGNLATTFQIATYPVALSTVVTITAFASGNSETDTLVVRAPAPLSVVPNTTSLVGGNQTTGTVTLDGPTGSSDVLVRMTDNSASILMSTYCIVLAGQNTGSFNIWTYGVAINTTGTISAYANGVTKTCTLTLLPASLSLFWVSPTTVVGGNASLGNAKLDGKAPIGGISVDLTSNDASAAAMSASTVIAFGSDLKTFPISTFGVDAVKNVTITGVAFGITKTATLQVRPALLSEVTLASASIQSGTSTVGTLAMTGKTGPLGRTVSLNSNNVKVTVPATVYVPPQKVSWTFGVQSDTVTTTTIVTITATQGLVTKTVGLTLTP